MQQWVLHRQYKIPVKLSSLAQPPFGATLSPFVAKTLIELCDFNLITNVVLSITPFPFPCGPCLGANFILDGKLNPIIWSFCLVSLFIYLFFFLFCSICVCFFLCSTFSSTKWKLFLEVVSGLWFWFSCDLCGWHHHLALGLVFWPTDVIASQPLIGIQFFFRFYSYSLIYFYMQAMQFIFICTARLLSLTLLNCIYFFL